MNANQRRLLTVKNIAQNPSNVELTRYPMIDDGIGGSYPDLQNPQIIQTVRGLGYRAGV